MGSKFSPEPEISGRFNLSFRQRDYLSQQYGLELGALDQLLGDLTAFTQSTPEEWVVRRHQELQDRGWPNNLIYARLTAELEKGRFRSRAFSERQIRRTIYG